MRAEQAANTRETKMTDTATETGQSQGTRTARSARPTYEVGEAVAELPSEPPRAKPRLYYNLLDEVKQDEANFGLWVPIATFTTPTGARDVQRAFTKQEREVPKGEWEFKAVKLADPDNPTKRISKLYVRYMGEG